MEMKGNRKNRYQRLVFSCLLGISCFICGCQMQEAKAEKIQDVEFVLVEEDALPEELLAKIEENKATDMKLVWKSGESTYIVRGYGEQETGGYSIQILELYQTKNSVILKTNLLGPAKGSVKNTSPSFPYVVLKTKTLPETLIFD